MVDIQGVAWVPPLLPLVTPPLTAPRASSQAGMGVLAAPREAASLAAPPRPRLRSGRLEGRQVIIPPPRSLT